MTVAGSRVPSVSETVILSACPTTWLLVTIKPGRIDDEARAGAHRLLPPVAETIAEFAAERGIAQFRWQFVKHFATGDGFGHRDIHHRRQHPLYQRGKTVGCRASPGLPGSRAAADQ